MNVSFIQLAQYGANEKDKYGFDYSTKYQDFVKNNWRSYHTVKNSYTLENHIAIAKMPMAPDLLNSLLVNDLLKIKSFKFYNGNYLVEHLTKDSIQFLYDNLNFTTCIPFFFHRSNCPIIPFYLRSLDLQNEIKQKFEISYENYVEKCDIYYNYTIVSGAERAFMIKNMKTMNLIYESFQHYSTYKFKNKITIDFQSDNSIAYLIIGILDNEKFKTESIKSIDFNIDNRSYYESDVLLNAIPLMYKVKNFILVPFCKDIIPNGFSFSPKGSFNFSKIKNCTIDIQMKEDLEYTCYISYMCIRNLK